MTTDDYDRRRQDSNDYLNRRDDQLDFERRLRERSDAVDRAIRDHNDSAVERELGISGEERAGAEADPEISAEIDAEMARASTFAKIAEAKAQLRKAFQIDAGYSDVIELAEEVLSVQPRNVEALTLHAIAYAQLGDLYQAVEDAEKAIAINLVDLSPLGVRMRNQLPAWRRAVGK